MRDLSPVRPPRWYLSGSVGFLAGLIGVSVAWQPTERVALATGIGGAVVAAALVELAVLWRPRRTREFTRDDGEAGHDDG